MLPVHASPGSQGCWAPKPTLSAIAPRVRRTTARAPRPRSSPVSRLIKSDERKALARLDRLRSLFLEHRRHMTMVRPCVSPESVRDVRGRAWDWRDSSVWAATMICPQTAEKDCPLAANLLLRVALTVRTGPHRTRPVAVDLAEWPKGHAFGDRRADRTICARRVDRRTGSEQRGGHRWQPSSWYIRPGSVAGVGAR
jgi:hypothetical protein